MNEKIKIQNDDVVILFDDKVIEGKKILINHWSAIGQEEAKILKEQILSDAEKARKFDELSNVVQLVCGNIHETTLNDLDVKGFKRLSITLDGLQQLVEKP